MSSFPGKVYRAHIARQSKFQSSNQTTIIEVFLHLLVVDPLTLVLLGMIISMFKNTPTIGFAFALFKSAEKFFDLFG